MIFVHDVIIKFYHVTPITSYMQLFDQSLITLASLWKDLS